MANGTFVAYYRVSTQQQGKSGLGMEAQKQSVTGYLNGGHWQLLQEFVEIESGKKTDTQRPQLTAAIAACRKHKASLIVAKLDRLSRDVKNFLEIIDSGIDVRFVEFPEIESSTAEGRLMLTQLAAFAEFERRRISQRTKAALAVAKQRGVVLGAAGPSNLKTNIAERQAAADTFALKLKGTIQGMQGNGLSQRQMVDGLNSLGIKTAKGGAWTRPQLQRVLKRLAT